MNLVYILLCDVYGRPPVYVGVFSSEKTANAFMRKAKASDRRQFGYANDYIVRPVKVDGE